MIAPFKRYFSLSRSLCLSMLNEARCITRSCKLLWIFITNCQTFTASKIAWIPTAFTVHVSQISISVKTHLQRVVAVASCSSTSVGTQWFITMPFIPIFTFIIWLHPACDIRTQTSDDRQAIRRWYALVHSHSRVKKPFRVVHMCLWASGWETPSRESSTREREGACACRGQASLECVRSPSIDDCVTWVSLFRALFHALVLVLNSLGFSLSMQYVTISTHISPLCAFARSLPFPFADCSSSAISVWDESQSITIGRAENTPFACKKLNLQKKRKEILLFLFLICVSHNRTVHSCTTLALSQNKFEKKKLNQMKIESATVGENSILAIIKIKRDNSDSTCVLKRCSVIWIEVTHSTFSSDVSASREIA